MTITNPTNILAPDEIPSTNGPAIGFRKKVCSKKPDTDNPPPKTAAANNLGKRIFQIILLSVLPDSALKNTIRKILNGEMDILPVLMLSISATTTRLSNKRNTI